MDKELEALWNLQEIIKAYDKLRAEKNGLKNLPEIKMKEEKLAAAKRELSVVSEQIKLLTRNAKNQEMDCDKLVQKRKDLEREMYRENTKAKELSSLQQQLEHTKKEIDVLENSVINTAYELEGLREREEALQKQIRELEISLSVEKAKREGKFQEINEQLKELKEKHESLKREIDPNLLKVYAKKFKRYSTSALAEVNRGICGGCHIHLPTYIVMEAKKKSSLVTCENCGRILYHRA
ncbi:MAG: hypothetical protein GX088_05895 [Clostridia bacterium]|nr:hypothetical protein [Clostridia bacterium]